MPLEQKQGPICQKCKIEFFALPPDGICLDCAEETRSKQDRENVLISALGGTEVYRRYTLDNLRDSKRKQSLLKTLASFNPISSNLYLYGNTGCGKSHLAVALVRDKIDLRYPRKSFARTQLKKICSEIWAADFKEKIDVLRYYSTVKILIIDDLGAEKTKDEQVESVLYDILDQREQAGLKGLIFTSNLAPEDLVSSVKDGRIVSRLKGAFKGCAYKVDDKDWRA